MRSKLSYSRQEGVLLVEIDALATKVAEAISNWLDFWCDWCLSQNNMQCRQGCRVREIRGHNCKEIARYVLSVVESSSGTNDWHRIGLRWQNQQSHG